MRQSKLRMSVTRKTLVVAGIVALMALIVGCGSAERADAVRAMNDGLEALNRGATGDAVERLKQATMADPTYGDPPYYLGQVYHQKYGDLAEAERYYRDAIGRDGQNPQYQYRLGTVYLEQAKYDRAIEELRRAVELKEDYAKAWFRLGLAQERSGEIADSIQSYMKSIRSNARMRMGEDDPGGAAYHALADLYVRFGFYDKALKVYENGLLNNPSSSVLFEGRGVAQLKLDRADDAIRSFKEALEKRPSAASALFNIAVAHQGKGDAEEAVRYYKEYLARSAPEEEARRTAAHGQIAQLEAAINADLER